MLRSAGGGWRGDKNVRIGVLAMTNYRLSLTRQELLIILGNEFLATLRNKVVCAHEMQVRLRTSRRAQSRTAQTIQHQQPNAVDKVKTRRP